MTFQMYADMIFKALLDFFKIFKRIDLVFDIYLTNSLKAATREKRGKGVRRRVAPQNKCPGRWSEFLKDALNKKELNEFLAERLSSMTYPEGRELYVTFEDKVLSNCEKTMPDCDHEEADSRLLHHAKHALNEGMTYINIVSNDTDVIILALGVYHKLRADHVFDEMTIGFGMGKNKREISIKNLANSLGQARSQALIFLHAFSGCDTISAFKSIGKKKAYEALRAYPEIESVFVDLYNNPFQELTENDSKFKKIERFVVLMYARTSIIQSVNEARMELYFSQNQNIETIPPTKNALYLHTQRAIYQSGIWSRCLEAKQNLPSPREFGWKEGSDQAIKWIPSWITKSECSKDLRSFLTCKCKGACTSNKCSCHAADLKCILVCSCKCTDKIRCD